VKLISLNFNNASLPIIILRYLFNLLQHVVFFYGPQSRPSPITGKGQRNDTVRGTPFSNFHGFFRYIKKRAARAWQVRVRRHGLRSRAGGGDQSTVAGRPTQGPAQPSHSSPGTGGGDQSPAAGYSTQGHPTGKMASNHNLFPQRN